MAIISFDKEAVVDYVPAYAGNRESADPCVVRLKFCPYSRVQHYSRLIATRAKGAGDNLKLAEVGQEVQKRQFVENVESVANYFVDGVEVRDTERFYETADTDLILEVIKAMESASRLSEGQIKN